MICFVRIFGIAILGTSLQVTASMPNANEMTPLSILSNKLVNDYTLSIVHISVFSTLEQRKYKGKIGDIVAEFERRIRDFETSELLNEYGYLVLDLLVQPVLPAIETNENGRVFMVNNLFLDQNSTFQTSYDGSSAIHSCRGVGCTLSGSSFVQPNLTIDGVQNIFGLLSDLAKRFGEGLQRKVQLVPLFLSRKIVVKLDESHIAPLMNHYHFYIRVGIALIAPDEDGYKPLAFVLFYPKGWKLLPNGYIKDEGEGLYLSPEAKKAINEF